MEVELGVRKRRVRVQPIRVPIDNFDDTEKEHLTFHYAFTPFIYTAHVFGLFPVSIKSRLDVKSCFFRWLTVPTIICFFITCAAFFESGIAIFKIIQNGITFKTTGPFLFYAVSVSGILSYFDLARKWPVFISAWRKIEAPFLESYYQCPESLTISKNSLIIGFGFLIMAFVEHLSSIGTSVYNNYRLMHRCNVTNMTFAEYHFHKYPTFTIGFGFTYYIIPLLQWIALSLTFSWNYIDVTMMLISKSLTCRLKQIHHRINTMAETNGCTRLNTTESEKFWCSMRTDFLNVLGLVRMVDEHFYILIMISSVNNFYYICNTILEGIQREANIVDMTQYWASFFFVLTRIMKTMFCEAEINEASGDILMSLHEFPASQWNVELKRLHQALSTEIVALSGNRFFYITKRLIFGMIGTTFIYLLVMIDQVRDSGPPIIPNPCYT